MKKPASATVNLNEIYVWLIFKSMNKSNDWVKGE